MHVQRECHPPGLPWSKYQQCPAPATALPTHATSTGVRIYCQPAPLDQPSTQSSQRQAPGPLPGRADHLASQRQAGVSCPYLWDREHWNQAPWPPRAVLGSSPGCPTSPCTWRKWPIHALVPPRPLPQPGQVAVISPIALPYLSALPRLGWRGGWLFRGAAEARDVSPPRGPAVTQREEGGTAWGREGGEVAREPGGRVTGSCLESGGKKSRRPERFSPAPAPLCRALPASWSSPPRPGE